MRQGEAVFADSGAWVAVALSRGPLHGRVREQWDRLLGAGARLHGSIPVVIETSRFPDRNANRDVALASKEAVHEPGAVESLPCERSDLDRSWEYVRRPDLHELSAVDATSFAIMTRARVRPPYGFDYHFAVAGSGMVA